MQAADACILFLGSRMSASQKMWTELKVGSRAGQGACASCSLRCLCHGQKLLERVPASLPPPPALPWRPYPPVHRAVLQPRLPQQPRQQLCTEQQRLPTFCPPLQFDKHAYDTLAEGEGHDRTTLLLQAEQEKLWQVGGQDEAARAAPEGACLCGL